MGQDKVQHGCNADTSRDTNHESSNSINFSIFPSTNEFSSICEHDVDLEKEEVEVEDDDDGNTYDIWDITVEDVEQIRQFLMPNVPDEMDESILDELLEEFNDEIVNVTMVNEEVAKDPLSHFTEIHVHSIITKPEPFIHTRPLSPLCGVFKTSKPCKVDRDIITYGRYNFYSTFPYPIANFHPNGVYCYVHPHLIPSEEKDTRLPSK
ncbi:hypothetical protein Tco_0928937 [Tanacetum coccineum]